jgi:prepilin-type processing-associated H-X9-DG protein
MLFDGFTQRGPSAMMNGDYSAMHFGGSYASGAGGRMGARTVGVASHNYESASVAFFDGHAESVLTGQFRKDPKYFCSLVPVPVSDDRGRMNDVEIRWNNTNAPLGYWTGNRGD